MKSARLASLETLTKPLEKKEARRLRSEQGTPLRRIAARLGVSVGTVHRWTRDIELTTEQKRRNLTGPRGPQNPEHLARRMARWQEHNRERRRNHQRAGRIRARERDPMHIAGCMLYWAEGAKHRNSLCLANSDINMLRFFAEFLKESLGVPAQDFSVRLNVYTNNGLSIRQLEDKWLRALGAPRSCLRKHSLDHYPTSSSGRKRNLPYGVCTLRVARSTWLVQHIFGAIQEYGGFEEARWLDGPLRRRPKKEDDSVARGMG